MFHFILHWFFLTGNCGYCFTFLTYYGYALLVLPCWTSLILFHGMLHWFFLAEHCLYCFTSWFNGSYLLGMVCIVSCYAHWCFTTGYGVCCFTSLTGSSILGMVCIVSFHASLVLLYWAWIALFHFMFYWFLLNGHSLPCFTSCFTGSLPVLVHHWWAHFVMFHGMPRCFMITGHDLNCFSWFTCSFLLGMICIVTLPLLVHHY